MAAKSVEINSSKAEQSQGVDLRHGTEETGQPHQEAGQPSTQPAHSLDETQPRQILITEVGEGLIELGKLVRRSTGLSVFVLPSD